MITTKSLLRNVFVIIFPVLLAATLWSQQPAAQVPQSAVPALPADIPANADRYSMLLMGNLAGQQAVWTASDGTLHMFFQFNDRGRGPKTTSIFKLDANGIPIAETITGNDYLKSPVDESFTNAGGTARWKNNAEQGEKKLSAPPSTLRSTARPRKSDSSRRPLSKTEAKSRCCPMAKRASNT